MAVDGLVAQQALWVLVHSARKCALIMAEAPSDCPDSRGLLRFTNQLLFHFYAKNFILQDLWSRNDKKWSWKAVKSKLFFL